MHGFQRKTILVNQQAKHNFMFLEKLSPHLTLADKYNSKERILNAKCYIELFGHQISSVQMFINRRKKIRTNCVYFSISLFESDGDFFREQQSCQRGLDSIILLLKIVNRDDRT